MTSIRAFVISTSMFLVVWLAASYATQFEQAEDASTVNKPSPAADQDATSTATERKEQPIPVAHFR